MYENLVRGQTTCLPRGKQQRHSVTMKTKNTTLLEPTAKGIDQAAKTLAAGGLVAFPTETVYGLGADARNGAAVAQVYQAKGRPAFNPLIVHVADLETARRYAIFDKTADRLAAAFWPGPMSLVLPLKDSSVLSGLVTAGLETVAIRIPAHPLAQELLRRFDGPVAAPSANISGQVSPTDPAHVMDGLTGRIDAIVNGGACRVGLESTILLPRAGNVALLRPGGIAVEQIEAVLGVPLLRPQDPETPRSPGQLATHYAPSARVRINARTIRGDELLLGFGQVENAALNLSDTGDLIEAAANLFTCLRRMDDLCRQSSKTTIAVSPVPTGGLGLAINDRLTRAASPE